MKKLLVAFMALAVAATVSMAGVRIDWTAGWGGFDHTADPNPTDGNLLLDSASVVWQLIYAGADNQIDRIDDPANPIQDVAGWQANNYLLPASQGGDDVLWGQRIISQGGGAASGGTAYDNASSWDNWMSATAGSIQFENLAWNTAGFVYQRVFEGTPANGSYFFETGLFAYSTGFILNDGLAGQPFLVDGTPPTYSSLESGFSPHQQVSAVPEPATMGLLGLGALVMAIRRRRS